MSADDDFMNMDQWIRVLGRKAQTLCTTWLQPGTGSLCVLGRWGGRERAWDIIIYDQEKSIQLQLDSELSPSLHYHFLYVKRGTSPKSYRPVRLDRLWSYPLFLVVMSQALSQPPQTHREPVPGYQAECFLIFGFLTDKFGRTKLYYINQNIYSKWSSNYKGQTITNNYEQQREFIGLEYIYSAICLMVKLINFDSAYCQTLFNSIVQFCIL